MCVCTCTFVSVCKAVRLRWIEVDSSYAHVPSCCLHMCVCRCHPRRPASPIRTKRARTRPTPCRSTPPRARQTSCPALPRGRGRPVQPRYEPQGARTAGVDPRWASKGWNICLSLSKRQMYSYSKLIHSGSLKHVWAFNVLL